jgi:hypothetical protein
VKSGRGGRTPGLESFRARYQDARILVEMDIAEIQRVVKNDQHHFTLHVLERILYESRQPSAVSTQPKANS